jgi:hypothetical protein
MTISKREMILNALQAFIAQRPGLEFGNYGDVGAYRSEMRAITKDRHIAEKLLAAVRWRSSIGEKELREAFRAFSGRLSIEDRPDGAIGLSYCTGQYFPTEYRKAACAVLAAALWDNARDNLQHSGSEFAHRPGDVLRSHFRKEFGRTIAGRYFS